MTEHPLLTAIRDNLGTAEVHPGASPGCAECGVPDPKTLISDDQSLVAAATYYGHEIPTYDDGYGPLWIYRDSLGVVGVVRAKSWESAYEIVVDEFLPDADPDLLAECMHDAGIDPDSGELPEGFVHRSNCDPDQSPVAETDLNGEALDQLAPELAEHLSVTIIVSPTIEELCATADEGQFSWNGCESCGSSLGGTLYPAHYLDTNRDILHLDVCEDCLMFFANGDLPEE